MIMYKDGGPEAGGEGVMVLKKGPWTAAEDETLAAYVREYGEGNWNAVQKKTWLARCGKSCRLRWANHLRPNLRKGSFSPHEERLIIQLHSQLGNKWARMAAQLPGRTDNEIKNYWNTRLKRFQRQGLPLYPPDILPYNHQQQQQTYLRQPKTPSSDLPSPTPDSSFVFRTPTPPPFCSKRSYNTAFDYLSTNSSFTSSPAFLHSYSPPSSYPVYSMKQELPSNQIPYSASLGVYQLSKLSGNVSYDQNLNTALHINTCQLLEDVMEEVEALADSYRGPKRRQLMAASEEDNFFSGSFRHCGSSDNLCSLQVNDQTSPNEEDTLLQMNTMHHEDIAKLLDWGSESGEDSNGQTSVVITDDNLVLDEHQLASLFQVDDESTNMNPTLSSFSWDNLPGIC